MLMGLAIAVCVVGGLALVLRLLNPLPPRAGFAPDPALPLVASPLEDLAREMTADHAGLTGVKLLPIGLDAFAMRLALARSATRSIDARYYIWEDDLSGRMLLAELIAAADRGARVRILIDDNPTAGLDGMWAAVNSHPNISVRIFNPLVIRKVRSANYLFDFPRLNRRMHNKSMTFDDAVTVVGGRNVGDEYFGARERGLFIDVDAVAMGPIVPHVSEDFERYWQSEPAYPAELILSAPGAGAIDVYRSPVFRDKALARDYAQAAEETIALYFVPGDPMNWAPVRLVSDNPAKALDKAARSDLLAAQVIPLMQSARSRFDLVSGYFVPTDEGTKLLVGMAEKQVATRVVTNSFRVTDVPVVHAGYAPFRKDLLAAGVHLYEARPLAGGRKEKTRLGRVRFSGGGESVHAKTFVIDDRTLFVGSFNFDPRSALLNCEMGFVIDSTDMAVRVRTALDQRVPEAAYILSRSPEGSLQWTAEVGGGSKTFDTEPGTTPLQRMLVGFLGLLPIKWLL